MERKSADQRHRLVASRADSNASGCFARNQRAARSLPPHPASRARQSERHPHPAAWHRRRPPWHRELHPRQVRPLRFSLRLRGQFSQLPPSRHLRQRARFSLRPPLHRSHHSLPCRRRSLQHRRRLQRQSLRQLLCHQPHPPRLSPCSLRFRLLRLPCPQHQRPLLRQLRSNQ